jgi:hypothetical protein
MSANMTPAAPPGRVERDDAREREGEHEIADTRQARPTLYDHDVPNFPEVSGTSFPVLATVLAGFAVTIAVQLILRPDPASDLPGRVLVALGALLLATLLLLLSTVFAINAQARNYLPFLDMSDTTARRLSVADTDVWLQHVERQWHVYHVETLSAFYGGVILLLASINLLVWIYVDSLLAVMFLMATLLSLGVTTGVARAAERASSASRSRERHHARVYVKQSRRRSEGELHP